MRLPAVDDRLARPEEGEEYVDGEYFGWESMAGDPEHADPQCQLAYLVRACVAPGFIASTELLTRTDKKSDFATDVCVRQAGKVPGTTGRYLEEISHKCYRESDSLMGGAHGNLELCVTDHDEELDV